MDLTYHATPKTHWDACDPDQTYLPTDFDADGFIHCTDSAEALPSVLTTYYKHEPGAWVVLTIDKDRVSSPIRYEDPDNVFPHIYGPLNRDAIWDVADIRRADDGTFLPLAASSAIEIVPRGCVPREARLSSRRMNLREAAQDYASAKVQFREELGRVDRLDPLFALVDFYYSDDPELALRCLRRALALDRDNFRALVEVADLSIELGDWSESYAAYMRAARINPDDVRVLNLRRRFARDANEVEASYQRIVELYPEYVATLQELERIGHMSESERSELVLAWPPGQHRPDE